MQNIDLRENSQHGGLLLPIDCYEARNLNSPNGVRCHWHEEMELFRITRGTMRIQAGEELFEASAGDLLFFNSGELHAAEAMPGEPCEFQAVVFSPDFLCGAEGDGIRMEYVAPTVSGKLLLPRCTQPVSLDGGEIHRCFTQAFRLLREQPELFVFPLKASMLRLFGLLLRHAQRLPEGRGDSETVSGIKEAISYIHENFGRAITLGELAELCSMSPGHFCRVFKQYTMKTPVQYINTVRLTRAMELLRKTDRKVLDVAIDSGCNSQSYFIEVFRENVGITPAYYRQQELRKQQESS